MKIKTEAEAQKWLDSLPEDERILVNRLFTIGGLNYSKRRFPVETKAALKRSKLATAVLMDEAQDDNELIIGLYSIRDFGTLGMLHDHRLNA